MTISAIQNIFKTSLSKLYDTGESDAITRNVLMEVLNFESSDWVLLGKKMVSLDNEIKLHQILNRLLQHEPMQYVLGFAWFCDLKLKVNKHTLIPRPETEELVDWIVKENKIASATILDIGTGSGCIAIALATKIKSAKITAIDISKHALQIAAENALTHQVKIVFEEKNILTQNKSEFDEKIVDIIVSNPPYVLATEKQSMHQHVLDFEPHQALFVPDNDALIFYKAIIEYAKIHLHPTGKLYFEINETKAAEVVELLKQNDFMDTQIKKDLQGKDRMVVGVK